MQLSNFFLGEHSHVIDELVKNHQLDDRLWQFDKKINASNEQFCINTLCFSPVHDSLAMGESGGKVCMHNLTNDQQTLFPLEKPCSINSIDVSPSGNYLVIGNQRYSTILFDTETQKYILWDVSESPVRSVVFDPTEKYIAIGMHSNYLNIISVKPCENENNKVNYIKRRLGSVACFDPTGKYLVVGDGTSKICIFDTNTWKQLEQYQCNAKVQTIAYSPRGHYFAAGTGCYNETGDVSLFDTVTKKSIVLFRCADNEIVKSISFHPSGQWLAIGIKGKEYYDRGEIAVHIINIFTKEKIFSFSDVSQDHLIAIMFNAIGNRFAIGLTSKILLYHNVPITTEHVMLHTLIYSWFKVKNQGKVITHLESSTEKDTTSKTDILLQCMANTFLCDTEDVKRIWTTLPHYMQELLSRTMNNMVNFHKKTIETSGVQIMSAIKKKDIKTIDILLAREEVDVNCENEDLETPLCMAIRYLNKDQSGIAIIKRLIQCGAQVNAKNQVSNSPLAYALHYFPWEEAAEILMENGADSRIWTQGSSMLHDACKQGFTKIVEKILLKHNYLLNMTTKESTNTALMLACLRNHPEVVRLLLNAGALLDFDFADLHEDRKCLTLLKAEKERRLKIDWYKKLLFPLGIAGIICMMLTIQLHKVH